MTDTNNNRVQVFDENGNHINSFGSVGSGECHFRNPVGVAVDNSDGLVIVDDNNYRVKIY